MSTRSINAANGPEAVGGYSQAFESIGATRRLYISGQIPIGHDGNMPKNFSEQAQLVWANVIAQLHAAEMKVENLVKVTIFLSDRKYADENKSARHSALQNHCPALTVIITGIFDQSWLLEVEAIAEA